MYLYTGCSASSTTYTCNENERSTLEAPSSAGRSGFFGYSVSASNDTLLVGAYSAYSLKGAAYMYNIKVSASSGRLPPTYLLYTL